MVLVGRLRFLAWLWPSVRKPAPGGPLDSARVVELGRRAELACEFAERALRPAESFVHGTAESLACELYAEGVFWALSAHRVGAGASAPEAGNPSLSGVWDAAAPELLLAAAGGPEALERLRADVRSRSFADFAELGRSEALELAARLAAFTEVLLGPLRSERRRFQRAHWVRLVRVGGLLFVLAALGIGLSKFLTYREEQRDLARRAIWTTSSTYTAAGGCRSPEQRCAGGENYFFHTLMETDPSIVFELRGERWLSRIVVENRLDCCPERAIPLVVEVSSDKLRWKRVVRRTEPFTSFRAEFPRVRARFVRLHVPGTGILHLSRVKLLP